MRVKFFDKSVRFGVKGPILQLCVLVLCVTVLITGSHPLPAYAASMKLYYPDSKTTMSYTGKQVTYNYNGTDLPLNGIKGIITDNGVALGPYYELFVKALGVSCVKDSNKNTLTFKRGSNKLILTLNSKTAILNGEKVTMSTAPVSVRFSDLKITRIMVPTRFVAESLGFDYRWESGESRVYIRNKLSLQYNNKQTSYIGAIGKVEVDGKNVSVTQLPTILINNTAMLRAYTVFKSAMGVTYTYHKSTGAICFKKGDLTLKMQENSTAAYLNGKLLDCGVAPIMVTNIENGYSALLVPGRFVAEALGYHYVWDESAKTSRITTTEQVGVYYPAPEEEQIKELVTYSFAIDDEMLEEYEALIHNAKTELSGSDMSGNGIAYLDTLYQDISSVYTDRYVVQCVSAITDVESSLQDNQLNITLKNTVCSDRTYNSFVDGRVDEVVQTYDNDTISSSLLFHLNTEIYYYNLELSSDNTALEITIYPNYLIGLETGKNVHGSYLRFMGMQPFTYQTMVENGYAMVCFENTSNILGNIVFPDELFEAYFEYALLTESESEQIRLVYKLTNGTDVTIKEEGKNLVMYFDYVEGESENEEQTSNSYANGIWMRLPSGVEFNEVTIEDRYWNQELVISLSGDYVQFFLNNPLQNIYSVLDNVNVALQDGQTVITLHTTRIQGYQVSEGANGFWLKFGNPSEIYDKIVVLDAGHGGTDPGASAGGYFEKDINFTILNTYTKQYFEGSDIKVYFTRTTDTKIDLYERAAFASLVEADLFVSLHMNSATATSAAGTSVYYSKLNTSTTSGGLNSQIMAKTFADNLSAALGTKNRGIYTENFVVVKETRMPAVLIELGFISNAGDRKLITTASTQKIAAKTIYKTIVSFFKEYPTGR